MKSEKINLIDETNNKGQYLESLLTPTYGLYLVESPIDSSVKGQYSNGSLAEQCEKCIDNDEVLPTSPRNKGPKI